MYQQKSKNFNPRSPFPKVKRAITLVEILIALSLLTVLLSTLFFWYHRISLQKTALLRCEEILREEKFLTERLEYLFANTVLDPVFFTSNTFESRLKGASLIFSFDHGIDQDPLLSNMVLGRLYLDEQRRALMLGMWPHPREKKRDPSRTIILIEDVADLSFSFYHPPELFKKTVDPENVGEVKPKEGWQSEWDQHFKMLPAMIKISLTRQADASERCIELAFSLPFASRSVPYAKTMEGAP